jgi:hypothetical protein
MDTTTDIMVVTVAGEWAATVVAAEWAATVVAAEWAATVVAAAEWAAISTRKSPFFLFDKLFYCFHLKLF